MNAQQQLEKYERLAEIAHKLGAYICARKWSIKAEKLQNVIFALKEAECSMISLEEAQEIYGDPQAIKRGYVTENLIRIAFEMATELKATGFVARDGMCCFPNVLHITENTKQSSLGKS